METRVEYRKEFGKNGTRYAIFGLHGAAELSTVHCVAHTPAAGYEATPVHLRTELRMYHQCCNPVVNHIKACAAAIAQLLATCMFALRSGQALRRARSQSNCVFPNIDNNANLERFENEAELEPDKKLRAAHSTLSVAFGSSTIVQYPAPKFPGLSNVKAPLEWSCASTSETVEVFRL